MQDRLADLGADVVLNYKEDDVAAAVEAEVGHVDVVFDTVGGTLLAQSLDVLAPFGRMVTIVEDAEGTLGPAISKNATVHFLMMQRDGRTMQALARLVDSGQLRPVVADVLPLSQVAEAHDRLEAGGVPGKLVLRV